MKSYLLVRSLLAILIVGLVGCGKSGKSSVDPAPLENNFANADEAIKAAATKAVNAVKSADYNVALAELLKLAADPKLTDSQKQAVAKVLDELKTAVVDAGKEAADDAGKALGDA